MPKLSASGRPLTVRLTVADPCAGVAYALQRGRSDLEQRQVAGKQALEFLFDVEVRPGRDGRLDFFGKHVQGRPGERFVYVCSGRLADQPTSCWTRRAKVFIDPIAEAVADRPLTLLREVSGSLRGKAGDGGPACARTEVQGGWRPVA